MKSIAWVNFEVPSSSEEIDYFSGDSLRDYDIVFFDPGIPDQTRIDFSGGGSCITIEGTKRLNEAMMHWSREINGALAAGKTVFVALNAHKQDRGAIGYSTGVRNTRTYNTTDIDNYSVLPARQKVRNARGQRILVKDPSFKGLYDAVKDIIEYRVVIEESTSLRNIFTAKDGAAVGGVINVVDRRGALVLLPYIEFSTDDFIDDDPKGNLVWNKKALATSHAFVNQLVAVDRMLRQEADLTPPPNWLDGLARPKAVDEAETAIADIDGQIEKLTHRRDEQIARKSEILEYSHLLYETGKVLEHAIEKTLKLLGYSVETLHISDLEIDHVIVGPSGYRMIGESEGKDTTAVDISKFRQLESNIGEDFEREEIDTPAKGILFGNGFRFTAPEKRSEQFTQKCLTNAGRLGSALVRTTDLYPLAVYLLDHPEDDDFRTACQAALEDTVGGIVQFPDRPEN